MGIKLIQVLFMSAFLFGCHNLKDREKPTAPNILWIVVEDMSPHWSCYGEQTIQTTNIDKLASQGVLFENAFVTAPVCSPARSALITGMNQFSAGFHNHRSQVVDGNGGGNADYFDSFHLPDELPFLPELFKEAGYFTVLGTHQSIIDRNDIKGQLGKTDYNFIWNREVYDDNDWSKRKADQPFFAQVQLRGGKFRKPVVKNPVDPDQVILPPYYPDDSVMRQDWAEYLNSVLLLDEEVDGIVTRLDKEGILENTVVFLFTDHGISHLRGKQFLYDEGIKIPLIVRWPPGLPEGARRKDLVSHIDIAATSLQLAGIAIPEKMQGKGLFGEDFQPRKFIYAARDRCDETVDLIRAVRTDRYKYIRNFMPHKSYTQPNRYKDGKQILQHLRSLHAKGDLSPVTNRYFMPDKPLEELFDLSNDPWELNNLADDHRYQQTLSEMRALLSHQIRETKDLGFIPEPILEALGKQAGNKYYVLQTPENSSLLEECLEMIEQVNNGNVEAILKALKSPREEIRFWAAYGLGNLGKHNNNISEALNLVLNDPSAPVRIAAARALCKGENASARALEVLTKELSNTNLITGMYAALFIEDLPPLYAKEILSKLEQDKEVPYAFTQRVLTRLFSHYTSE
jgi:arylsulfatase A-like enzyme